MTANLLSLVGQLKAEYGFSGPDLEEYLCLLARREESLDVLARFEEQEVRTGVDAGQSLQGGTVSKEDLRERFERYAAPNLGELEIWWKTTSGTTGRPVKIPYEASFYLDFKYGVFHKLWKVFYGSRLGSREYVAAVLTDVAEELPSLTVDPLFSSGLIIRWPIDFKDANEIKKVVQFLDTHNPLFVSTKPSVLSALLSTTEGRVGGQLLVVGGAAFSSELRSQVSARFSGGLVSVYATSEVGVIASECRFGRLHIYQTDLEVDAGSDGLAEEVVVTNLRNAALPLRRYKTGDNAVISKLPCQCNCKWDCIDRLDGRITPVFRFMDGSVVSPTVFNHLLREFASVKEFQVILCGGRLLRVIVELLSSADRSAVPQLERYFRDRVPGGVDVTIELGRFDAGSKFARYQVWP